MGASKGSIGNIGNINFLVAGASFCGVDEKTAEMLDLNRGEVVRTTTAAGPGITGLLCPT